MPYLDKFYRDLMDLQIPEGISFDGVGSLNYALTRIALQYVEQYGLSYQVVNDILGAFQGASQEFYRRVAAPYEDTKILANGDVYPLTFTRG